MLSALEFKKVFPKSKNADEWVNAMVKLFPEYSIVGNKRVAAFISQCGHESGGWRSFSENLNYSAKGLNLIFGKYFKRAGRSTDDYARQPEKIANLVYANRIGNGSTTSGDGWKYRGRGPIQLTGKSNYLHFSKFIRNPEILDNPDVVSQDQEIGLLSAIWFWQSNGLNEIADTGDIKKVTKRINGGYNGLEDRVSKYEKCLSYLNAEVLRFGSRGPNVKLLQSALGVALDGVFGKVTEGVVMAWQKRNELLPDGIVGKKTYAKLFNG